MCFFNCRLQNTQYDKKKPYLYASGDNLRPKQNKNYYSVPRCYRHFMFHGTKWDTVTMTNSLCQDVFFHRKIIPFQRADCMQGEKFCARLVILCIMFILHIFEYALKEYFVLRLWNTFFSDTCNKTVMVRCLYWGIIFWNCKYHSLCMDSGVSMFFFFSELYLVSL